MAKFFVGQRVRTKADNRLSKRYLPMVGKEGTITASSPHYKNNWIVDIDGHGTCWLGGGRPCSWIEDHLEPLIPPHEPGDWAEIDKLLPNLRTKDTELA